jgi:hypothetical protein
MAPFFQISRRAFLLEMELKVVVDAALPCLAEL